MGLRLEEGPPEFQIAVLDVLREPLKLVGVRRPRKLQAGQVFVRLIMSGACASQVHEIDGRKGPDPFLPHALGHEGVGEVVDVGPGVSKVGAGDTVILHWRIGSGIQAPPAQYESHLGTINSGSVTTFGQYSVVSENRLTKMPPGLSLELAPLFGCSLTTGFGCVVHEALVTPGESAVIIGFGGVGIAILKALKLVSAEPILVVDISEAKTALALEMGADFSIQVAPSEMTVMNTVVSTLGRKPDVVFEVTGHRHLIEQAFDMTDANGRTVLVGVPDSSNHASLPTLPLHLGKTLIGSHGGSSQPDQDIPRLASLVRSNLLNLGDIPLSTYPLKEINSALDSMRTGSVGRALITME